MPRPKGSKNKPKEEVEVKRATARKPTPESIQKKIDALENKKKEIDVEIEKLNKQIVEIQEREKAQAVINEALRTMSASEIAERLKRTE